MNLTTERTLNNLLNNLKRNKMRIQISKEWLGIGKLPNVTVNGKDHIRFVFMWIGINI